MKPRIAMDARMIGMGGIGRYAKSLIREMIRQRPEWRWIWVGAPEKLLPLAPPGAGVEIRECRARIYSAEETFGMSRHFGGVDLLHVPHFNAPFRCSSKLVVTLHDLIHFDYPEYQPFPFANGL